MENTIIFIGIAIFAIAVGMIYIILEERKRKSILRSIDVIEKAINIIKENNLKK